MKPKSKKSLTRALVGAALVGGALLGAPALLDGAPAAAQEVEVWKSPY